MLRRQTASEFLSFIEEHEIRLLNWGFYNVSFSEDELESLLEENASPELLDELQSLSESGFEMEMVLEEMSHKGLLYDIDGKRFRSRFAEAVRLISNLRQMFKESDWSTGPQLVSDIKLQINPRRYPRRDQTVADCWEDLRSFAWKEDIQKAAFEALSGKSDSTEMGFARFQRSAFGSVLANYGSKGLSGSIVTAGTGSGKTKAFYVPAFLGMVTELEPGREPFTKVLATYPRNVLLADQLREALSEATKLRPVIERFGLRQPSFGALLGTTPEKSWFEQKNGKYYAEKNNWKRVANGFVVPFLKSPTSPEMDLIWRDEDRLNGRTSLYRSGTTDAVPDIPDGILVLTREDLKTTPPDILFLSIEMLNREMGNPDWGRTFGFNASGDKPRLLLLDEVHAYEGLSGAQVAWVLRRWKHWAKAVNLHVVGLSATLKDATNHLGIISGVPVGSISEFSPSEDDLTLQDAEYNLAVKGDPTSGTSLLSTTIQTGMLLTRVLTPSNVPHPNENDISGASFYGRKVFGFTDNLDSLNRWYSDMNDAEKRKRLARLRLSPLYRTPAENISPTTFGAMNRNGQIWELPRLLGHNLNQALKVTRCSSQDPGANAGSDLIVASASLEVGFDDPEVGAMLHHKKPVSISSFIQRKGRAGRRIGTRPWTITVLSDYGADRWTFQNAERLFQPDIERIRLPILNPYVLRIQAAYFLIDWLGHKIGKGSPFNYLAGKKPFDARQPAIQILKNFVDQGNQWKQFKRDFTKLFGRPYGDFRSVLNEADIDELFWGSPRPILLQVVPSLLRKIEESWRFADPRLRGKYEDSGSSRPIPNFIPSATFNSIGGSGANIVFPLSDEKESEPLAIRRALDEACPGRVSKRYSLRVGEPGYWHAYSEHLVNDQTPDFVSVKELFPDRILLGETKGVSVFQPFSINVVHRPNGVRDTCNSFWRWESEFSALGSGQPLPLNLSQPWRDLLVNPQVHLHRDRTGIEVTRFSQKFAYELRLGNGNSKRGKLYLATSLDDGGVQSEAVGYKIDSDGVVVSLSPEFVESVVDTDDVRRARFRPDYYLSELMKCELLDQHMNSFLIEWMWQVSMSMLSATALSSRCSIKEAQQRLKGKRPDAARKVLNKIFQMRDGVTDTGNEDEESRLKDRILEQWKNDVVVKRIQELESLLWIDLGEEYQDWVRGRFVSTIAQAMRASIVYHVDEIGDEEIAVDTHERDDQINIFLTETSPGGTGQVEALVGDIRLAPERFDDAMRFSLSFCPRDTRDRGLLQILSEALTNNSTGPIAKAFQAVRKARGFQQMTEAKNLIQEVLSNGGLNASREAVVSLLSRIVGPGSSMESDRFIYLLNRSWRKHENRLGVTMDPRTFAYLCVQYRPFWRRAKNLFRKIGQGLEPSGSQIFVLLQQMLFAGCKDSCQECLGNQRSSSPIRPSRELTVHILNICDPIVDVDLLGPDWLEMLCEKLASQRRAILSFSTEQLEDVIAKLQSLLASEVESDFVFLPVSISGLERDQQRWLLTVEIRGNQFGGH